MSIDFNLSSNSPLNFAPAIISPRSKENIFFNFKESGTSSFTILKANPSIIAVFPTPGSPIRTGLFLVLRERTWILLLISSSLPITGSSLPFLANLVTSTENFFKASVSIDLFELSIVCPFLILSIDFFNVSLFKPFFTVSQRF